MIRQGDLLFIPATEIPEYFQEQAKKEEAGIVERGEATGHHHWLDVLENAEVLVQKQWNDDKELYVTVGSLGVSILHEEHKTVTLQPGTYKVHKAREFDYLTQAARYVAD